MSIRIKNWREFQHYKRRNPPWIRLYRKLLDDPEWFALDGDASKMLANCWLLASERDGTLPPIETMAFRLRMDEKAILRQLSKLNHWLESDASTMLAPRLHDAPPETESETESETERKEPILIDSNLAESPAGLPTKQYAFEGKVIKLNQKDFSNWVKGFPELDLRGVLLARDAWLAESAADSDRKKWFVSTPQYLSNLNIKAKAQREGAGNKWVWKSGIEGVI